MPQCLFLDKSLKQPLSLSLLKVWPRQLKDLRTAPKRNPSKTADRPQNRQIDQVPLLIDRILPDPEPDTLNNRQHARLFAGSRAALELLGLNQLPLDGKDSLLHARRSYRSAWCGVQPGYGPLGDTVWRVDGRVIGRFYKMLADNVDDALTRVDEVSQRIFRIIEATAVADAENWRIVVHDSGIAERGQVRRGA